MTLVSGYLEVWGVVRGARTVRSLVAVLSLLQCFLLHFKKYECVSPGGAM